MKRLIIAAFVLLLTYPSVSYSEESVGTLEISVKFTNEERVDPSDMIYRVYQDSLDNHFKDIEATDNPYYLTSVPLNHKYIVEVYKNDMYAGSGFLELTSAEAELDIKIALGGGFRFNVFYEDGNTPVEGAFVSIKSQDGSILRTGPTDSEGKTLRFWLQSTITENNYYIATVSMGEHVVYEQSNVKLEPGERKEVKVVTPWPSRVDQLMVSVYKTPSEKLSESDGKVIAELRHADGEVTKTEVNRKGDAFFTGITVGDYTLHMSRVREGLLYDLEDWGSVNMTLVSYQLSTKFVRTEPFVAGWKVSNEPYPPAYDRIFSVPISNLGTTARNVTISLIFDRDRIPPYDIVKDLSISIPAESTKSFDIELSPNNKGLFSTYILVKAQNSVITDQIAWQPAFEVTRIPPIIVEPPSATLSRIISTDSERAPTSCNCVAFRLDDVQDYFTRDGQKDLIDIFVKDNVPLTIGVIGGFLQDDKDLIQFLQNAVSSGRIEVANHSWEHLDHSAMTVNEQRESIVKTNERIRELFGVESKTFIPPVNTFNNDTLALMKEAGLTHLSASSFLTPDTPPYPLKNGDQIFHFPETAFVSNIDTPTSVWTVFPNENVLEMIRSSIEQYGFVVVNMHAVAYYDKQDDKYVYHKERMASLPDLLKQVNKEFNLVKISEIDKQGWISKSVKETLITDLGPGHGFAKWVTIGKQVDNTDDFVIGNQSLKLTTEGDGQAVYTRKTKISPAIDFTDKFLKVWVKVNDTSKISELRVSITGDNFKTFRDYRLHGLAFEAKQLGNNQWNEVIIMPSQTIDIGTPDISNINAIQLRVADKGTGAVTAWFNGLALLELEDTRGAINMSAHAVAWKGKDLVVASSADFDFGVNDEKLYIDKTTNAWEGPVLLELPKAMVPQEPIVMAEEKVLPTMSWLDPESRSWIVYVDPPQSAESVHVVPEFDITLLVLALTFGFLLSVRIFRNKGLLHHTNYHR
ncbi:MAG TPA: polysaccharide deacetylase family protein [Nitrososphaerales archaeon]|nr:polysaccharide deacetylase family protein [Nitrososphaerales archaeon]